MNQQTQTKEQENGKEVHVFILISLFLFHQSSELSELHKEKNFTEFETCLHMTECEATFQVVPNYYIFTNFLFCFNVKLTFLSLGANKLPFLYKFFMR